MNNLRTMCVFHDEYASLAFAHVCVYVRVVQIPEDHITRYEAYKGRLRQYVAEAQRCHQQQQHEGVISAEGNSSETSKSDASSSSSTTSSEEPRDSPSSSSATNAFSTNPRVVPAFVNTELLELSTRHGFAFAVRAAIAVVQTEYVMVIQHDRRYVAFSARSATCIVHSYFLCALHSALSNLCDSILCDSILSSCLSTVGYSLSSYLRLACLACLAAALLVAAGFVPR